MPTNCVGNQTEFTESFTLVVNQAGIMYYGAEIIFKLSEFNLSCFFLLASVSLYYQIKFERIRQ